MVRQVRHSDESASDWDSLSESGAPAAHPPAALLHDAAAVVKNSADEADDPLYSEIKRPHSDTNRRTAAAATATAASAAAPTRPASSGSRGPLTFVDRNLPDDRDVSDPLELSDVPAAFRDVDVEELRTDEADAARPARAPPFRSTKKKRVSISNGSSSMRDSFDLHPSPHRRSHVAGADYDRRRSSSSLDSTGFDNVAFEGDSQRTSPPLAGSRQVYQVNQSNQMNHRTDAHHQWKAGEQSRDDLIGGGQSEKVATVTSPAPVLPRPDETIEIFHFDRGSTEFFQVSEKRSRPMGDRIGDTLFQVSMRFWSEALAVVGLPFVCLLALLLQLLRFASVALLRPLVVGVLTGLSDGLLKPVLSVGFNSVVQPFAALLHNIGAAVKSIVAPLADSVALLLAPVAHLLRSFRLVEVHRHPPVSV